jgi:hypothetical protein
LPNHGPLSHCRSQQSLRSHMVPPVAAWAEPQFLARRCARVTVSGEDLRAPYINFDATEVAPAGR